MPTTIITWQNLTNAVINGNGYLEKNAGANNCFTNASGTGDGGARSVQTIASTDGDWAFECTLGPDPSGRSFVGIASGAFSLDFATWDYCLHISTELNTSGTPHPANSIFIYEGPAPNKTYRDGVWNEGDLLQIICVGGVVRYYVNCTLLYTSSRAPSYPCYAVASLACLNKYVVDPVFRTGGSGGSVLGATRGPGAGSGCSAPWTMPTPAAFPLPSNGGPRYAHFAEVEGDWGEDQSQFKDGYVRSVSLQPSATRFFDISWDGLSAAEAATLDAHWSSSRGGLAFSLTLPTTGEVVSGVRYASYSRANHRREWAQERSARLVKYTS